MLWDGHVFQNLLLQKSKIHRDFNSCISLDTSRGSVQSVYLQTKNEVPTEGNASKKSTKSDSGSKPWGNINASSFNVKTENTADFPPLQKSSGSGQFPSVDARRMKNIRLKAQSFSNMQKVSNLKLNEGN